MDMISPKGKKLIFHFVDTSLEGTEDRLPADFLNELYEAVDKLDAAEVHVLIYGNYEDVFVIPTEEVAEMLSTLPNYQKEYLQIREARSGLSAAIAKDCPHCPAQGCERRTAPYVGPYPTQPPF